MVKLLVLQQWHSLSDPEHEKQVTDRISFRKFLGFPAVIPDFTTIRYFRERLAKTGKDRAIWEELQRQLDSMGLKEKLWGRVFLKRAKLDRCSMGSKIL